MKIHINDTPLFKEVAAVIGGYAALEQLIKAGVVDYQSPLNVAFAWGRTRGVGQGTNFWHAVDRGVNPLKGK